MRMIMGLKGAVLLASTLGYTSDVKNWNDSINLALRRLNNESMYNKYESYDYFGCVLWGLQSNLTSSKTFSQRCPHRYSPLRE